MMKQKDTAWTMPEAPWRVRYRNRNWRNKPDPSGFSFMVVYCRCPKWAHQLCLRLEGAGHFSIVTEKRPEELAADMARESMGLRGKPEEKGDVAMQERERDE